MGSIALHRGAFCKFLFRWIYYYGSNKSTGNETGKTHLCALVRGKGGSWPAELVIFLSYNKQSFCRKHFLQRGYMKTFGMHPEFDSYLIMIMVILFRVLSHEHAAKMFFKFLEITLSRIRVIYYNPMSR